MAPPIAPLILEGPSHWATTTGWWATIASSRAYRLLILWILGGPPTDLWCQTPCPSPRCSQVTHHCLVTLRTLLYSELDYTISLQCPNLLRRQPNHQCLQPSPSQEPRSSKLDTRTQNIQHKILKATAETCPLKKNTLWIWFKLPSLRSVFLPEEHLQTARASVRWERRRPQTSGGNGTNAAKTATLTTTMRT